MSKVKELTPFEQAQKDVREGKMKTPNVSVGSKPIDYFGYQLAIHKFNLGLMAKGMRFKHITITQIKKYYGLKGSADKCVEQFEKILTDYKASLV
jgi:hypothetical protein